MSSSIFRSPRARLVALAVGVAVIGPLAMAAPSLAGTASGGTPVAGTNCVATDGKITGRGSTLQTWLQDDLIGSYTSDVCGPVAAQGITSHAGVTYDNPGDDPSLGPGSDPTDPGTASSPNQAVFLPNFPAATFTLCTPTTLGTCNPADQSIGDGMIAYNDQVDQVNGLTGSGYGQTAIWCRSDAFGGTDIPVTSAQLNDINTVLPSQGTTNQALGKPCDPATLKQPFAPTAGTGGASGGYPNLGDVTPANSSNGLATGVMLFPIGGSAVAIAANLKGTVCQPPNPAAFQLKTSDMSAIWSGNDLTWNQVATADTTAGFPAGCAGGAAVPIVRVVRADNSGTVQSFLNYLNDATGGASTAPCGTASPTASFAQMQANQGAALGNSDVNWPNGPQNGSVNPADVLGTGGFLYPATATCSAVEDSAFKISGGPALIYQLEQTVGAIGFADYADMKNDPANLVGLTTAKIQNFPTTTTTYQTANSGSASNCNFSNATLPGGGGSGAVQLNGADWNLDSGTSDDVSWTHQSGSYPICSLTWDFVWAGIDGNPSNTIVTPSVNGAGVTTAGPIPVASAAEMANAGSFTVTVTPTVAPTTTITAAQTMPLANAAIQVGNTAGLAPSGTFTVPSNNGNGIQTLTYTGISGAFLTGVSGGAAPATTAAGATATFTSQNEILSYTAITGANQNAASLTMAADPYAAGSIANGASLTLPAGSGGPEPGLTADQRRNLYSYFTYVLSPAAQESEPGAGYAQLPASWLDVIRGGFQGNF